MKPFAITVSKEVLALSEKIKALSKIIRLLEQSGVFCVARNLKREKEVMELQAIALMVVTK